MLWYVGCSSRQSAAHTRKGRVAREDSRSMRKKTKSRQIQRTKKGAIKDLEPKADPQGGFLACAPPGGGPVSTLPLEQGGLNYSKVEFKR